MLEPAAIKFQARKNAQLTEGYQAVCVLLKSLLDSRSEEAQQFHVYELDLDRYLVRVAARLVELTNGDVPKCWTRHYLRLIWRVHLRRFALCGAIETVGLMRSVGERWPDSWWRVLQCLIPLRFAAGLLVGFLATQSSSGLGLMLEATAANPALAYSYVGACTASAALLGFVEVQQRTRGSVRSVVSRAMLLFLIGLVQIIAGFYLAEGAQKAWHWAPRAARFNWVYAFTCWPLAFIVQLFWRDQSAGDPL